MTDKVIPSKQTIQNTIYLLELFYEYEGVHKDIESLCRAAGVNPEGPEATLMEETFDSLWDKTKGMLYHDRHQYLCLFAKMELEKML